MNGRILALAAVISLLAGAAPADDPMANAYDNTVMTYVAMAIRADSKPVQYSGSWSLKDGGQIICLG